MSKEFNVPPVVFPSGGNPGPSATLQRRPTAPFQPRPSPNPIPFMSFDIGPTTTSFPAPQFGSSNSLSNFDDEPPLLEELGINTKQIWSKTTSILNPFRSANPNLHDDADLSGPVLCLMMFGLFQLLAGKIHFGIILGWVTVSALFLYVVFNMLAGRNGTLDLYRCVSLIGYCMLPMVILSAMSLFLPQGGAVISGIAAVFVIWSSRVCTRLLVQVARWDEHRGLVAIDCLVQLQCLAKKIIQRMMLQKVQPLVQKDREHLWLGIILRNLLMIMGFQRQSAKIVVKSTYQERVVELQI